MLQKLKNIISSPAASIIICIVIVGIVIWGLLFIRQKKDQIRPALAPVRNAAEIIYTGKVDTIEVNIPQATTEEKKYNFSLPKLSNNQVSSAMPRKEEKNSSDKSAPQPQLTAFSKKTAKKAPVIAPKGQPLPMMLYQSSSTSKDASGDFAPFGRILRCELSYTISTASLTTPVIGVVTEALWWDGKEIIPVGCEVHSTVSGNPSRDRIGTSNTWKIIYPFRDGTNGYSVDITGIALDCNRTENGWAKSDGSAGIRGKIISNQEQLRLNALLSTFISGLGEGMSTTEYNYVGGSTEETSGGTWKDAFGKALYQTGKQLSQELLKEASQNIYYVEAEAGTEFYIYITQPLDTDAAQRAQITIPNNNRNSSKKDQDQK